MKHWSRRAGAAALALVMGLSTIAVASDAMGNEVQKGSVDLSVGTNLTKQIFWSDTYSDLRTERYFTYTPSTSVVPVVAYGDKVLSRATLTSMAQGLEKGGKRVVGGINGDYYTMATGEPVGMVVSGGILRSSSPYDESWAVGFRANGTAFIGRPQMSVTANFKGLTLLVGGGVNKVRTEERGYYLFTDDFASTTQNTSPGVDVILTPVLDGVGETVNVDLDVKPEGQPAPEAETGAGDEAGSSTDMDGLPAPTEVPTPVTEVKGNLLQSGKPTIGGRVTYKVEQVLESTGAVAIPAGGAVLSINAKSPYSYQLEQLRSLQPGDLVNIDVTTGMDTRWAEADQAIGALYKLVSASAVQSGLSAERTARSAIGIKADGSVVFYTMDGKQPGYSIGATLTQVAMRMIELGCVEAVCMDGGGSTTIGATYPDGSGLGVISKPSDGSQRPNSTAVFLATDLKATGELGSFYVTPNDGLILAGSKAQMKYTPVDTAYYAMGDPGGVTWSAGGGTVDESGLFTAGASAGVNTVTASFGEASGSAALTVVKTPDKITLTNESTGAALPFLSLDPGQTLDLKASAVYKTLAVASTDGAYTWTLDPGAGTVDANGVVTASATSGSGNLTVSAGGASVTIPVTVAGSIRLLDGFEQGVGSMTTTGSGKATVETGSEHVKYGAQSMRFDYDATASGTASVITTLTLQANQKYLSLWVYGDGSANTLTATVADSAGTTTEVVLTGLDFTGWKQIRVALPAGAAAIRTLNLIYGGGSATGTVWLDQITSANEDLRDATAPVVTVSVSGTALTASVVDNLDKRFDAAQVSVTYDGKSQKFTFDAASNTIKATLPAADGKLHRVTVAVSDASGNLGRGTANIEATAQRDSVFADIKGHWAEPYATYLYDQGITTGVPDDKTGLLYFQPDKAITRGEFFVMVARWMRVDLTKYAGVELPFVDRDKIPDWAVSAIKAMYAMGILKGSDDGLGNLSANAGATISRAEAMTILGRAQRKGFAEGSMGFSDAAKVPDWAAPYVKTLVAQGVVNGTEGNLILPNNPVKRCEVAKMLFTMT